MTANLRYECSPCKRTGTDDVTACLEAEAEFFGVYRRDLSRNPPLAMWVADFGMKGDADQYVELMNWTV